MAVAANKQRSNYYDITISTHDDVRPYYHQRITKKHP